MVNQLRINTDNSHHRYDVILLINGVPIVQIELKTLAVSPRRAMQQIVEYKNDQGSGYGKTLLCFIQLFIVSNRTDTWYFANNNARHFSFNADERFLPIYQYAAEDNKKITYLDAFADKFLAKCTLGQMISRYMVLVASEQKLMAMRPYQIYAVKALVECIQQNVGNGYVWHTTGRGLVGGMDLPASDCASFFAASLSRGSIRSVRPRTFAALHGSTWLLRGGLFARSRPQEQTCFAPLAHLPQPVSSISGTPRHQRNWRSPCPAFRWRLRE